MKSFFVVTEANATSTPNYHPADTIEDVIELIKSIYSKNNLDHLSVSFVKVAENAIEFVESIKLQKQNE